MRARARARHASLRGLFAALRFLLYRFCRRRRHSLRGGVAGAARGGVARGPSAQVRKTRGECPFTGRMNGRAAIGMGMGKAAGESRDEEP